jgi:hypothetical protein
MFLLRSSILLLTGMIAMSGSVVNACHDDDLYMIVEDGIIYLGKEPAVVTVPDVCHGTDISFRYEMGTDTQCDSIYSMRFTLDGTQHYCETTEPFAMFGNSGSDYNVKYLVVGAYAVHYHLYDSNDCSGPLSDFGGGGPDQEGSFSFNVITCPNP